MTEPEAWRNEKELESRLNEASARQDDLLAELRLVAPGLYPSAADFRQKCEEMFFGIWEDVDGEGHYALVDWRDPSEIPQMIESFASVVNEALRLVPVREPGKKS